MLPINILELDEMIDNNEINQNFEFIDNPDVMYYVVLKKPELIDLLSDSVKNEITNLLVHDNSSLPNKKEVFFKLITFFRYIPNKLISLIENVDDYVRVASQSFVVYEKLYNNNHPYKEKEKELFFALYEDGYRYNSDYEISYAKKSPKALLNTLKNDLGFYYISYFDREAVNDEVIDYLDKSNMIDMLDIPVMYISPKIILLKLKRNLNFWPSITEKDVTDEIINYLKQTNFNGEIISEYLMNNDHYPTCLKNPKFILMLLEKDISNIKYYNPDTIDSSLILYLNDHNYIYQKGDNYKLLNDLNIYNRLLEKGDINILLSDNIPLKEAQIKLLLEKIVKDNIDYHHIDNVHLLSNQQFCNKLVDHYKINNPYNLANKYLISNLGSSLDVLSRIFPLNDINIIIREIIKNNYHINMLGILNKIDINKFKLIYDKLYICESKFNTNFSFSFFIKVMEYFGNNLTLLQELNNVSINDNLINNISLAINRNQNVDYEELINYQEYCRSCVEQENVDIKSKIFKLLVNGNTLEVGDFLQNIADTKKLLYLQLEVSSNQVSILLELYLDMIDLLEKVYYYDVTNELFNDIKSKMNINPLFDLKVMQENILKMYGLLYKQHNLDMEKLREKGKVANVEGTLILDISEEDFTFYVHTENFNNQEDFTIPDYFDPKRGEKNYICTSYANEFFPYCMDDDKIEIYDLDDINSLIAFGNDDIMMYPTKAPLYEAECQFVNPIDMSFINGGGYTPTEFDFLRYDDHNRKKTSNYKVVKTKEEALKLISKTSSDKKILIFDPLKNKNYIENKFNYYCENVSSLNWKDLYKLVALSKKYPLEDQIKENIIERINELSEKEQIVLTDALVKYNVDIKKKQKHN